METTSAHELASCLRAWRERVSPVDIGLPTGGPRRVRGLRREEVAQFAGVSMDYLTRLEQGRALNPSASILGSLARALRLSDVERDHLYQLAGQASPGDGVIDTHIPASVLRLMDRLSDVPVMITTVAAEIVAANPLAMALCDEATGSTRRERTLAWRRFMGFPTSRVTRTEEDRIEADELLVADLQSALAQYPADTFLTTLVSDLRDQSPGFEELWSKHRLRLVHTKEKRFIHREVGELTLDCDHMAVHGSALQLVVFSAAPGSPSARALQLLGAIGLQRFESSTARG